ncbi:hypothetical protein ACFL3S_04080 [Gemmatimonadota bacterium]
MARHNREGRGADQRGNRYGISYQPDWLRHVKVTRDLETGRQSTKTLFRNPTGGREAEPGEKVRTRITSRELAVDLEVVINDPRKAVRRVRVAYVVPGSKGQVEEEIEFTLENNLPKV